MPIEKNKKFEFVKTLYDERLNALTTTLSLRVIYELTKVFDIPMTEFCQYLSSENEEDLIS